MVKIRLKQQGKRGQKSYRIVVMNSLKWRDGATIEEIGFYNPSTNPSEIRVDMEKYNSWVSKGAQPSNSVKVMIKNLTASK